MKQLYLIYSFVICGLLLPLTISAQSTSQNYILTRTMTNETGTTYLDKIQYFDGLGRPVQLVQKQVTPTQKDLVSLQEYDIYGRESMIWLPAAISGNNGNYAAVSTIQANAKTTNTNGTTADQKPYSLTEYEPSPLNRVVRQYGPGAEWQANTTRAVNISYTTNNSSLTCIRFVSSDTRTTVNITRSGNYANGQLFVTKTADENGNISYEFKNKLDQIILTRQMSGTVAQDTYYVYDSFGNLRAVIPPIAVDLFTSGTWTETTDNLKKYAYVYKYDERNHCIAKKLPGCDWTYYVYDKADRLIFSQDGEQRTKSEWAFSIPDVFGRVTVTGTCKNTFTYTARPLKTAVVKGVWGNTTNTYKGYNISGITLSTPTVYTVNYYDQYDFLGKNGIPNDATKTQYNAESGYGVRYTGGYRSFPTGSMTAQMTATGTVSATYLYSTTYFDYRGRPIQSKSNNHFTDGVEKEYIAYNFIGQPTLRKTIHSATGKTTQTEVYTYAYDHAGRVTQLKHKLNAGTEILLATNTYDELGRLKTTMPNNQANLKATYDYNVRSWTRKIAGTYFTESLVYSYSGNIITQEWMQDNKTRKYNFGYDPFSFLRSAVYTNTAATTEQFATNYNYDKHGNIINMSRHGLTAANTYGAIDVLAFGYNGNQLKYITDSGPNVALSASADFKDYTKGTAQEYTFNQNGAMTKDMNKGISSVTYNSLNLPRRMDIKSPVAEARNEYTYSATGQKLQTVQKWNPNYSTSPVIGSAVNVSSLTSSKTTDYVGNKIYENGTLKKILTDNGYYESGIYYFYIKDHLGNNRIVANQTSGVVQSTQYYPFGMAFADGTGTDKQPYKYNGKELDTMHGLNQYDYSARYYDPAFCRFTTVDPMAEKYYSLSPYVYVMNNPLKYIDPDGCSTHTDSLGHVVAVYNDGNMGVYKHNINAESYDGSGLSVENGTNMGETEYWDEFLPDFSKNSEGFTIQFGKSFDGIIDQMHEKASSMNLKEIAAHSAGGGLFDIKKDYPNIGRKMNGKYVSSRSAGNYLAGYNASEGTYLGVGISFETFQKLAGALHIEESAGRKLTLLQKVDIVVKGTYPGVDASKFKAPYWGEMPYQYRMSKKGWNHGK